MIGITVGGDTKNADNFLAKAFRDDFYQPLETYGREVCDELSNATPRDSGLTAASWSYEIVRTPGRHALVFHNSNVNDGRPIAILIQYGHGTATGGYVEGRDFINPVIRPYFDKIADEIWKAVTK